MHQRKHAQRLESSELGQHDARCVLDAEWSRQRADALKCVECPPNGAVTDGTDGQLEASLCGGKHLTCQDLVGHLSQS